MADKHYILDNPRGFVKSAQLTVRENGGGAALMVDTRYGSKYGGFRSERSAKVTFGRVYMAKGRWVAWQPPEHARPPKSK